MTRTLLIVFLGFTIAAMAIAAPGARHLPTGVVQKICDKYNGAPAFIKNGQTTKIDCPYVDNLANIEGPTVVEVFREILASAATLDGLRKYPGLPGEISCGDFSERRVGKERIIECTSRLRGDAVPNTFFADESGRLVRFETSLDYRKIYRASLDAAVLRGSLSSFYDAYVDLNTDLLAEKLRYTVTEADSVTLENGKLSIVVAAPGKKWWKFW